MEIEGAPAKIKILVVEDENIVALDLERGLKRLGYDVVAIVGSGPEALDATERHQPQLVLMDIQIKGPFDGIETARRIRESYHVPVIFLTAYADEATLQRAKSAEPFGYLLKPFEESELHTAIEVVLHKHRIHETQKEKTSSALRLSQEALRLFVDGVKDYAILMLDPDGRVTSWNTGAARIFGYEADEVIGRHFSMFYPPEEVESPRRSLAEAQTVGKLEEEGWRLRKDGSRFWANTSLSAVVGKNDVFLGFGKVTRDLTAKKRDEEALRAAKEAAETANVAKSAFLANMSHEIRTPLGAVMGFSELLGDPGIRSDEKARFIDAIQRNGELLLGLIDDILDLSKVEAGKVELNVRETALTEILSDLRALLDLQAKNKGIRLSLDIAPSVPRIITTDPIRLRQILLNIVGNAIKFTSRGSVDVSIKPLSSPFEKNRLAFVVSDTGKGIREEDKGKLFAPFSQADVTSTRKYGGAGLGLALARRLANALGGDVVLTSTEENRGSTFTVTIDPGPMTETLALENERPATTSPADIRLDGVKVLLVEDARDNQILVSHLLKAAGARVDVAADGREAVQMARAENYDVMLMDLQMPVMDGYAATAELRQNGYPGKIFALTAHAMTEDRRRCLENGFDGHMSKPVNKVALIKKVAQASRKSGS